jgi:hypothetical protein
MKKQSLLSGMVLAAAAMAVGMTSCSQEEVVPAQQDGRITFTSYVPLSRASQDLQATQIAQGVQVGVFVTNADGSFINNGENNLMTADGAGSFTVTNQMYWPSTGSANIYAYAPYNSSWTMTGAQAFTVSANQTTDEAYLASDLLYGTPASNPVAATENAVPLVFGHKLSKVNITLVSNDETVSFNNSTVTLVGVANKTYIDLSTGVVEAADAEGSVDIKAATFGENETAYKCAAIIVPQTVSAGSFLMISTADKAYSCSLASDMEFKSGLVYNFTVTVNGNQADLDLDSTITDWENGGDTDLDPEEVVPPVVYEVGDYLLSDGTMVKKAAYTTGDVVGVVFSTEVSETDAAAGYKGYILGVKNALSSGSAAYGVQKGNLCTDYAKVENLSETMANLDGLSATEYYNANTVESNSAFAKAAALEKVGDNYSVWFVPSVGQMIQILNNFGQAGIAFSDETTHNAFFSATAAGELDDYSVFVGLDKATVIANVKSATGLSLGDTATYVTASYRGTNYVYAWEVGFKCASLSLTGADTGWTVQCNSDTTSGGKRAVFCVAYK